MLNMCIFSTIEVGDSFQIILENKYIRIFFLVKAVKQVTDEKLVSLMLAFFLLYETQV